MATDDIGVKCLASKFEKKDCSISINICVHKDSPTHRPSEVIYDVPKALNISKSRSLDRCFVESEKSRPPVPSKPRTKTLLSADNEFNLNTNKNILKDQRQLNNFKYINHEEIYNLHKKLNIAYAINSIKVKPNSNDCNVYDAINTVKVKNNSNDCNVYENTTIKNNLYQVPTSPTISFTNSDFSEEIYINPDDLNIKTSNKLKKQNLSSNGNVIKIIDELICTEENYIQSLHKVIFDYKRHFKQTHAPIIGKEELFGNIEQLHTESISFLDSIKRCKYDVEQIAKIFIFYENILFVLYPIYCKNKPLSNRAIELDDKDIIKNRQLELRDAMHLNSYLIMPIQRIGRYVLLLEDMEKELSKEGITCKYLTMAKDMVKSSISEGNTFLQLDEIENISFDLNFTGNFIIKENFCVYRNKQKLYQTVFLFEHIILFGKYHPEREKYVCAEYIDTNRVNITHRDVNTSSFSLNYYTNSGDIKVYQICATSNKPKQAWLAKLEEILWKQLKQQKEIRHRHINYRPL